MSFSYDEFSYGDRALKIYDVFKIFAILQNHNHNMNGGKEAIAHCTDLSSCITNSEKGEPDLPEVQVCQVGRAKRG